MGSVYEYFYIDRFQVSNSLVITLENIDNVTDVIDAALEAGANEINGCYIVKKKGGMKVWVEGDASFTIHEIRILDFSLCRDDKFIKYQTWLEKE